jgi:fructoselysine 6-kinase
VTVRAVCVGDNCIDRYLPPVNQTFVGGNALNVAVYLQQAGVAASYAGVVGDDEAGRRVLETLRQRGIDTTHVQALAGQTAYSDIRLDEQNNREFIAEYLGPKPAGFLSAEAIAFIAGHDLVHTTLLGGTADDLPRIEQAGARLISMDYGERAPENFIQQTLPFVDLAFFSLPEERYREARALAERILGAGPRLAVVTMGARGSLAYDGESHFQPAVRVQVVDTLGAGDSFIGTFLGDYLRGRSLPECLAKAAETAAHICTHYGAFPQS